jgi:hypothetical protein
LSTAAGRDLRLNSTVAAFAQLKHNYVLIAGQEYNEGGCEIPDGYVEPVPAVYAALIDYAARGEQVLAALDSVDRTGGRAYFQRLGRLLQVLRRIALDELAGRPLSVEERRFLAMVSELAAGSSGGPPTYTGWYFDLFRQRQAEGLATSDLIADYYTASGPQEVAYAGVAGLELGLFVVDTGGAPRLFVGPVARAFEHHGPLAARLDDEAGRKLPEAARQAPWAASYTVAAPAHQPSLAASYQWKAGSSTVVVSSEVAIGAASVALLDHHRQPLATVQSALGVGETTVRFPLRGKNGQKLDEDAVGGISIRVGEHYLWAGRRGGGEPGIYLSGGN